MQQRQLRLGDILDDYCPRERRVTNHAVVAMVGADVKQTRCTTCDAEHEFKHAKVPRQRRKADTPAALYAQVAANGPKRVAHEQRTKRRCRRREGKKNIVADDIEIGDNGNEPAYPQTAERRPSAADGATMSADSGAADASRRRRRRSGSPTAHPRLAAAAGRAAAAGASHSGIHHPATRRTTGQPIPPAPSTRRSAGTAVRRQPRQRQFRGRSSPRHAIRQRRRPSAGRDAHRAGGTAAAGQATEDGRSDG